MSCCPLGFLPRACAASPSAVSPSGFCTLAGVSACLAPVCWSPPGIGLEGSLLRHLVFSHVLCSSSGPAACAVFPAADYLGVFWSPGVCPSASLVTWASPAPLACWGSWGLTLCQGAPVAVMSAWFAGEVTLLPFPYLRVGVLLAFGVSGVCGLHRRSRLPLVVPHPFPVSVGPSPFLGLGWLGHSGRWIVQGTCSFLGPYLGFFPLTSSVGCWLEVVEVYPWFSPPL